MKRPKSMSGKTFRIAMASVIFLGTACLVALLICTAILYRDVSIIRFIAGEVW